MIEKYITIPPITIDPICVFFDERKDEQKIYNQQQETVENIWKDILYDEQFVAAEFQRDDGETLILHVSPREDVDWQLSHFDSKGPIMHENYICDENYKVNNGIGSSMKELINNLLRNSFHGSILKVKVLTEERELTVQQLEFFKKSKVRDENGNLMEVYHGSKERGFNSFEYSKDRQTGTDFGEAYYFTSDYRKAMGYAYDVNNDERVKLYLQERDRLKKLFIDTNSEDIKNQFLNVKVDGKTLHELIDDELYYTGGEVKKVYLNLTNPLMVDAGGKAYYDVYEDYFKMARKDGHDGIIVKNVIDNPRGAAMPIDVYIAFSPEQIKDVKNKYPQKTPYLMDMYESLEMKLAKYNQQKDIYQKCNAVRTINKPEMVRG